MAIAQKGAISFALVYIPVELYTATQDNDIRFNQLAKESKGRVRYKKVDEKTGKELRNDEIVKAYQYEKNKFVEVTDEDFEKIKTEKDRSVQILQFCGLREICPVYFDKTYYVVPQKGGEKAFELLRRAMLDNDKVAIGQTVMGNSEVVLVVMPADDGMCLQTLFYEEEVKALPKETPQPKVSEEELTMAGRIIASMVKPFEPERFHDEYQRRLRELIENKIEGREITAPKEDDGGRIINLMDALKASVDDLRLDTGKGGKAAKPARAKRKAGA